MILLQLVLASAFLTWVTRSLMARRRQPSQARLPAAFKRQDPSR